MNADDNWYLAVGKNDCAEVGDAGLAQVPEQQGLVDDGTLHIDIGALALA